MVREEEELLAVADLDPAEREEIERMIETAKERGGYLHIEIRRV